MDSEKFFGQKEKVLKVDVNEFMNEQTGPGRFITAADFSFIKMFFEAEDYIYTDIHEVSQNPLTNLKTVQDILKRKS